MPQPSQQSADRAERIDRIAALNDSLRRSICSPGRNQIVMTAGVAETNRAPFDFPEAEQELVAGYHTEYSSMSFAMFFLAEYINMVTVSAIATDLYLGGWHGPLLPEWLGWIWFLLKVGFLLFFYVWMRWTLPRYRYDQLMAFGWKFLLPLSVVNLLATAAGVLYFER